MWPFRKRRGEPAPSALPLPPELEQIGDKTPRRFSITIEDPRRAEDARQILATRLHSELKVGERRDAAGRVVFDLDSAFKPGSAAILRPLNVLSQAGIGAVDLDLRDLVTDASDQTLRRLVEDWRTNGNVAGYRRRVEVLVGLDLLDRCVAAADAAERARDPSAAAWRFAVRCIAFNTPGSEVRALAEAASGDERRSEWLVDAAHDRVELARLGGLAFSVPATSLVTALSRRGFAAERAAQLAMLLPAPLDPDVAAALRDLVRRGGDVAQAALGGLHHAEPTPDIRAAADEALASDDANVRAAGLGLLAHHWTEDARPVWREALAARSAPMRWAAESTIGLHGTEDDLADAAAYLSKLIRSRQAISMSPPRGHEIVDLLSQHRERPEARAGLEDLTARWTRLSDDMRTWLEVHHPELAPTSPSPRSDHAEALPEEELTWPVPTIDRDGQAFVLTFDEAAAHHPVRERFETLITRHPSVEILDGDREWLSVRIDANDPAALVADLWRAASSTQEPSLGGN